MSILKRYEVTFINSMFFPVRMFSQAERTLVLIYTEHCHGLKKKFLSRKFNKIKLAEQFKNSYHNIIPLGFYPGCMVERKSRTVVSGALSFLLHMDNYTENGYIGQEVTNKKMPYFTAWYNQVFIYETEINLLKFIRLQRN